MSAAGFGGSQATTRAPIGWRAGLAPRRASTVCIPVLSTGMASHLRRPRAPARQLGHHHRAGLNGRLATPRQGAGLLGGLPPGGGWRSFLAFTTAGGRLQHRTVCGSGAPRALRTRGGGFAPHLLTAAGAACGLGAVLRTLLGAPRRRLPPTRACRRTGLGVASPPLRGPPEAERSCRAHGQRAVRSHGSRPRFAAIVLRPWLAGVSCGVCARQHPPAATTPLRVSRRPASRRFP